jgi:hypothetical protein
MKLVIEAIERFCAGDVVHGCEGGWCLNGQRRLLFITPVTGKQYAYKQWQKLVRFHSDQINFKNNITSSSRYSIPNTVPFTRNGENLLLYRQIK